MSRHVTLELPDEVLHRAARLATRARRDRSERRAGAAAEGVKPLEETVPLSQVGKTVADAMRHVLVTHDFSDLNQAVTDLRAQEARLQAEREQAEQMARQAQRI